MRRYPKRIRKRARAAARELHRAWQRRYRRTYPTRLDRVATRDELPALLNARGLTGQGAEIGVKGGVFSAYVLRHWRGSRLISIDHWEGEHARHYSKARQRLAPFGARSEVWRMTSLEAAAHVEDRSLDFVYIDAAHDAESVANDLRAWFPKVRSGGIIAGHDYAPDRNRRGVKSVVDAFFSECGLPVAATRGVRSLEVHPSWIVRVEHRPGERGRARAGTLEGL